MSTTTDLQTRARHSHSAADVIGAHALRQVTAYTARADRAAAAPESTTESAHRDRAAYWACTARQAGATEEQIIAAETAAAEANP